jgi:hypothetical protein
VEVDLIFGFMGAIVTYHLKKRNFLIIYFKTVRNGVFWAT